MVDMNENISTSGAWNSMFRHNSTGISLRDAIAEKFDNSLDQFKRLGKKYEDCKIQFGFTIESPKIAYVFDNAGMRDGDLETFLCIFKPGKKEDEGNLIGQHGVGGQIADYLLSNQGTNIVISKLDDLIQIYCVNFQKINEAANEADNKCMSFSIKKKFKSLDELFEFAKNDTKADPGARARIREVEKFSRKLFDKNGNGTVFLYNDIQENGNNNITNLFKSLGSRSNDSSPDFDQKINNEDFIGHTYYDYINNKSVTIKYIDSRVECAIVSVDPTYVSDLESYNLEEDNVTNCGDKFKPLSNIIKVKVKVYRPFDKNNEGYIIETPKDELIELEKKHKDRFDQMGGVLTYTKKRQGSIKNLPRWLLYQKGLDRELTKPLNNDSEFDEKKFNKKEPYYLDVTFTHTEQLKDKGINYNESTCGITITRMGKSLEPYFPEPINKKSKLYEAGFGRYGYTAKLRGNENTHFRMKISFDDSFCNRLFPSKINKSESGQSVAATCITDLLFRALRVLWPMKVKPTEKVDDISSETSSETSSEVQDRVSSEVQDQVSSEVQDPVSNEVPPYNKFKKSIVYDLQGVRLQNQDEDTEVSGEDTDRTPDKSIITSNNLLQEPAVPNSRDLDTQNQNPVRSQKPPEEFKKQFIELLDNAKPEWFKWMREELEKSMP